TQMFAPEQYIENAAIPEGSQQRVEFALKLPCRDGEYLLLPIDSKFPQEDYIRLMDAQDDAQKEKCARQLERAVLEQAKTIAEKYIRPPQTADFAVLFLPAEGLYAEAARMPGLIERAQTKHRVLIAGPSTLCALLTSLQVSFRTSALEKRSGEVLELFDELRQEFARFNESISRMRQRINQTEAELDAMEARARKIGKKLM
ncbi:MAG: DNA recombination protein RmuC, partial [Clostridia bacterium]|nr:DNA recombination protein RmuC [Clostridia bacterium]